MIDKSFVLACSIAAAIGVQVTFDDCLRTGEASQYFDDDLEWNGFPDSNLRRVRIQQSDDAVFEKVEVCFDKKFEDFDWSDFPVELPTIQGFWAIVAYEDEYSRYVYQGPVGTDRNCIDVPVYEGERVSMVSHTKNWGAFALVVAEEQDGEWVNTKERGAYRGIYYEQDFDPRRNECLDVDIHIDASNRQIVGLQGLFEDGEPVGIDWILADTQCIADRPVCDPFWGC